LFDQHDPGIVHQHVDMVVSFPHLPDAVCNLFLVRNIAFQEQRLATLFPDLFCDRLALRQEVQPDRGVVVFCKDPHAGCPDPLSRASDNDHFFIAHATSTLGRRPVSHLQGS
jgi:hypothetical protein